jgi:hypothetical protein
MVESLAFQHFATAASNPGWHAAYSLQIQTGQVLPSWHQCQTKQHQEKYCKSSTGSASA